MKKFLLFTLLLAGVKSNAQISNDMELWQTYNAGSPPQQLERPLGWHGLDSLLVTFGPILMPGTNFQKQVFKTTDKHAGNFAAMLMTRVYDSLFVPGVMTNATITADLANPGEVTFSGGEPTNGQRIQYVNAWVKYAPNGNDTAGIIATAVVTGAGANGDSTVGVGFIPITATANYTLISVQIQYTDTLLADRIQIQFVSSNSEVPQDSSKLFIDDVTYTLFPAGIANVNNTDIKCYPNPSNGILYLTAPTSKSYIWQAYNNNGQVVAEKAYTGNTVINVSHLASGVYFYTVKNNDGVIERNGKFILSK